MVFSVSIANRTMVDGKIVSDASTKIKVLRNLRDFGTPALIGTVSAAGFIMFGLCVANLNGLGKINHTIRFTGAIAFLPAIAALGFAGYFSYKAAVNHNVHDILNKNRDYSPEQLKDAVYQIKVSSYWSRCLPFTLGPKELKTLNKIIELWTDHIVEEVNKELAKETTDLDNAVNLWYESHSCYTNDVFRSLKTKIIAEYTARGDRFAKFLFLYDAAHYRQ